MPTVPGLVMDLLHSVHRGLLLAAGYLVSACYGGWFLYDLARSLGRDPLRRFWRVKRREAPSCLQDPALGTHRYVQLKDVKLHYVEAGDPSRPLMLFVHGFPEFWYSWRHQIKEFSSDYWVVAVDMRGYGESDKPKGRKHYKLQILVEDIKNLILELGRKRCTLVAHDWGGVVAWCLVLTEPQMFDSYVIMNSIHPEAFNHHLKRNYSQFKKSWYVYFFQLPWLPELWSRMDDMLKFTQLFQSSGKSPSPVTDEDIEAFKYTFGKPGAMTPPINYYRANFLLSTTDRLRGLGKDPDFPPGLILFGENDEFINKEVQEITLGLVANSTLVYIKGANHFVQQDDPASVNAEMRQFLAKVQSREQD